MLCQIHVLENSIKRCLLQQDFETSGYEFVMLLYLHLVILKQKGFDNGRLSF